MPANSPMSSAELEEEINALITERSELQIEYLNIMDSAPYHILDRLSHLIKSLRVRINNLERKK